MKKIINCSIYIIGLVFLSFQVFSQVPSPERVRLSSSTSSANNSQTSRLIKVKFLSECQTIMFINVICPKLEIKKATISFGNQTIDCQVLQINSNGEQGVQICINKQLDVSKFGKLKIELGLKDNLSGSYENLPAYFNNSIGKVRKGEIKFSKDSSFIIYNNKYKSITTNSSGKRKKRIIMDNGESLCDELVTQLEYNFDISVQMLIQKAPIDAHKKEKN